MRASNEGQRERLLDVAERLFAEHGIAETSVRAITSEAGVNVAAINYYFGSREELVQTVIARRLAPVNQERVRLLDACLQRAGDNAPAVEDLLHALAAPSLDLCFAHPDAARLASQLRLHTDRSLWREYRSRQAGLITRFQEAFAAALPELPSWEIANRLHYVLGAIHHIWSHCPLPPEQTEPRLLASFLAFYSAGLRAPAPPEG